MGFLDSVSNSLNRGVNTVSRPGKTAQLNMQLNELMKQRQGLAAQLGASLYDQTKGDPTFTTGREAIYNGIASIDAQRAQIEAQIEQIKLEQAAETAAAQTYRCPRCGTAVGANDLFCSGCGLPIYQVKGGQPNPARTAQPVAGGRTCPNCGAPMGADDLFCMSCGTKVDPNSAPAPASEPTPAPTPVFDSEPTSTPEPAPTSGSMTEPASEPEPTPEPGTGTGTVAEAEVASQPEPESEPGAAIESEPEATPKPMTVPASASEPTSVGESVPEPEPAPAPEPEPAAPTSSPKFCYKCGAKVNPGEKFCFSCGTKLV